MLEAADRLKSQCQSQLELTLNLCNLGLGCCERLTEINGQSARALLTQAGTDGQSWLRGDATGLMVGTSRTVLDHWGSMLACYTDLQRQVLAGLAKK
ncbi:MAG: hypothetical protein FD131_4764 [Rhodocyclaceae bacterium]|nr:MAG: hypothetical protein FD131_4764 [Rhodocyclaceae bacterium]